MTVGEWIAVAGVTLFEFGAIALLVHAYRQAR